MSDFVVETRNADYRVLADHRAQLLRLTAAALLVGASYYLGAKVGFALTFQPHPVSTLWPPNSIVLAALLLSSTRSWWLLLLAVFPAHLLVQLNAHIPTTMVLCWYVSNCSEALISASLFRYLTGGAPVRFDNTHHVSLFTLVALTGPFLSSFLDAAFVMLNHFGTATYWDVFRMRFFSNVLASFVLVPLIVSWSRVDFASLRNAPWQRYLEAAFLAAGLVIVGLVSFRAGVTGAETRSALIYLPLPLLLWATIRFGPNGSSAALLAVSFFEIWAATHDLGPFTGRTPELNALAVQLFLSLAYLPLLFLAALIKER